MLHSSAATRTMKRNGRRSITRGAALLQASERLRCRAVAPGPSRAATADPTVPPGAWELPKLMARLRLAPCRRYFKTVPMILEPPDFWDDEALKEVIAYHGAWKQVWNNTDLEGPWLNGTAQIVSFGHKDFLAVSTTHGGLP